MLFGLMLCPFEITVNVSILYGPPSHTYNKATIMCINIIEVANNKGADQTVQFCRLIKLRPLLFAYGENWSSGFPTRSDTNRAVQPRKMARGLKFHFLGSRGIVISV